VIRPIKVVLRLAAEGGFRLDDAANDHLRTVRLGGDAVTIR
jgi:CubicO group peptidase (beta-lactamase class C family)